MLMAMMQIVDSNDVDDNDVDGNDVDGNDVDCQGEMFQSFTS